MACRDMKDENYRWDTFQHPDAHYIGQSQWVLVRAGFFYTGPGDKVECYSCGITHENWYKGDKSWDKHHQSCSVIDHNAADNTSVVQPQPVELNAFARQDIRPKIRQPSTDGSIIAGTQTTSVIRQPHDESESYQSDRKVISLSNADSGYGQSYIQKHSAEMTNVMHMKKSNPEQRHLYYYDEQVRLTTFIKWPYDSPVRPIDLARGGLYYTGEADRVKCAFCRGVLHTWEAYDVPDVVHQSYFRNCPFVRDPQAAGNVPINEQPQRSTETVTFGQGVVSERPIHCDFTFTSQRLESFSGVSSHAIKQIPHDLTQAGFFYTGIADNVKCFFCDGGLRNWGSNNDPWTEHARCFPHCGFMRREKGEEFIKTVSPKYMAPERHQIRRWRREHRMAGKHRLTDALLAELMVGDIVEQTCQMGCKHGDIKIVTIRRMQQLGEFFVDADSLYEEVKDYEAEYIDLETVPKEDKPSPVISDVSHVNTFTDHPDQDLNIAQANFDIEKLKEERTCKVCLDEDTCIVFLPCGHLVCCQKCARGLQPCPICRTIIQDKVRVYT